MIPIGDEYKPLRKPVVNYSLIIINTMVFFYFFLQGHHNFTRALFYYGMIPFYVVHGKRLWTLITSMFMHGSLDHLFGNMLYLYIFGDNVEDSMGHAKYLLFYVLSGIGASIVHILTLPPNITAWLTPAVGASGAISGVLGAYMLLHPRVRVKLIVFTFYGFMIVRIPAYYFIALWFLYQYISAMWVLLGITSNIAFWAHIGGFLFGILLTLAFRERKKRYERAYQVRYKVYRVPVD